MAAAINGREARALAVPDGVEPLRFSEPMAQRAAPARSAASPRPGAGIIDRYVYGTTRGEEDRKARGVEYLGVMERPSDGFTCLAVRMPGSTRRHFVEVAMVVEVEIASRVHRPTPQRERHEETAAKLRDLIEG